MLEVVVDMASSVVTVAQGDSGYYIRILQLQCRVKFLASVLDFQLCSVFAAASK